MTTRRTSPTLWLVFLSWGWLTAGEVVPVPAAVPDIPQLTSWEPGHGSAQHDYATDPHPTITGSFLIRSTLFAHPTLTVDVIIPTDQAKHPLTSASDLIAYFPYPGQRAIESGVVKDLAQRWGFTVYTVYFPNHAKANQLDREHYWIYPEAGAVQVWLTAASGVRIAAGLPAKPQFVIGYSCGASAGQLFSSGAQDRVAGAVFISGRTFDLAHPYAGPQLIMRSDRDREEANQTLEAALSSSPIKPIHLTFAPDWASRGQSLYWEHNVDSVAWDLAERWLSAVANLRTKNGGALPPPDRWSQVRGTTWPDPALAERARSFPTPPVLTPAQAGWTTVTVRPPAGVTEKGSVAWIDRRFAIENDELIGASQIIASRGLACFTANNSEPEHSATITELLKKWRDSSLYPPPRTLVMVGASSADLDDLAQAAKSVGRLVLIAPHQASAAQLITSLRHASKQVAVVCRQAIYTEVAPLVAEERNLNLFQTPSEGFQGMGPRLNFWITCALDGRIPPAK